MDFLEWLKKNRKEGYDALIGYVSKRPDLFLDPISDRRVAEQLARDTTLSDGERSDLTAGFSEALALFGAAVQPETQTDQTAHVLKPRWQFVRENASLVFLGIIIIIAIGVLATILYPQGNLLTNLGKTEVARGLITFVFAFGVIFVTLILLIALFGSSDPRIGEKFDRAKELFTAMIAVFGTILGFYFGQAETGQIASDSPPLDAQERVLFEFAKLGMNIEGVELSPNQVSLAGAILQDGTDTAAKLEAIEKIFPGGAP